jgi:hypothetical protein
VKLVIVAKVCQILAGIPDPVCTDKVALDTYDGSIQTCYFGQAIIAQWKANSKYADEEYTVRGYKCVFGTYVPKNDL